MSAEEMADEKGPKPVPEADLSQAPDPKLLEILVCPLTKTRLEYDVERKVLLSRAAGLAYPIVNGVPLMIADAARPIEDVKKGA